MTEVKAQELHALAREVAAAIGPGWEYVQPGDESSNDIIRHRDGPSFSVTVVWNQPDRVQVHGGWPRTRKGGVSLPYVPYGKPEKDYRPEITVSVAKGPRGIAKDILSRFLPKYLPLWQQEADSVQRETLYASNRAALLEELADVVGVALAKPRPGEDLERFMASPEDGPYVEVEATDRSVTLNIHNLLPDQAKTLLKASGIKDKDRNPNRPVADPPELPEPDLGATFP